MGIAKRWGYDDSRGGMAGEIEAAVGAHGIVLTHERRAELSVDMGTARTLVAGGWVVVNSAYQLC